MFTCKPCDIACNILSFAARLPFLPLLKWAVSIHTPGPGLLPPPIVSSPLWTSSTSQILLKRPTLSRKKNMHSSCCTAEQGLMANKKSQATTLKGKGWCCGWNWKGKEDKVVGCTGEHGSPWAVAIASPSTHFKQHHPKSALFLKNLYFHLRAFWVNWHQGHLNLCYTQLNSERYLTWINTLTAAKIY